MEREMDNETPVRKQLNVLVPLDGSSAAERVIPVLKQIGRNLLVKARLLHALERNVESTVHGERHLTGAGEANRYLETIASSLRASGIQIETHVHDQAVRNIADSIVEHAVEMQPDLVVMCTHGAGYFHGLLFGSVAQQVLKQGLWPLLLVPARCALGEGDFKLERLMLPIDGKHLTEHSIKLAAEIARAGDAELHLVNVVGMNTSAESQELFLQRVLPSASREIFEAAECGARAYLEEVAELDLFSGINVNRKVLRGAILEELVKYCAEARIDLVALVTHAQAGLLAASEGSLGQRLISTLPVPLLIVKI